MIVSHYNEIWILDFEEYWVIGCLGAYNINVVSIKYERQAIREWDKIKMLRTRHVKLGYTIE